MITCDNCGMPLHTNDAVILWQDRREGGITTVTALIIVHKNKRGRGTGCDDGEYLKSAGAAYGSNWDPVDHAERFFAEKGFALSSDKRSLDVLIAQRRSDVRSGAKPEPA